MSKPRELALLLTCEHGGNRVPATYRELFKGAGKVLASHRGLDIGALDLSKRLRRKLVAPLQYSTTTRLLVDLNRSPTNPARFSDFTRGLTRDEKTQLDERYHHPYWNEARASVDQALARYDAVLLFSIHTFTPRLNGITRATEIGLLYDPKRALERQFSLNLRRRIREFDPALRVRMNYPYQGRNDALATRFRHEYPRSRFLGVEIEVNQGLFGTPGWNAACRAVGEALAADTRRRRAATLITL